MLASYVIQAIKDGLGSYDFLSLVSLINNLIWRLDFKAAKQMLILMQKLFADPEHLSAIEMQLIQIMYIELFYYEKKKEFKKHAISLKILENKVIFFQMMVILFN